MPVKRVCVFCGSSAGIRPEYTDSVRRVADLLTAACLGVVYGGSSIGLMGVLAESVLSRGGTAIGVYPRILQTAEPAYVGLSELVLVDSLQERKTRMNELADAFLALPGGMGTLDELSEVITWAMLGIHEKPIGVLNVNGYFDHLVKLLDHMVLEGFLRESHRRLIVVHSDASHLVDAICVQPVNSP